MNTQGSLRYPAEQIATVFLALMFTQTRNPQTEVSTGDLIDILLHGSVEAREPA